RVGEVVGGGQVCAVDGQDDVQALGAGKLDEALQIDGGEPLAHVARGRNDVRPGDAVAGIDVEDDAVANVEMIDRRAAHMQFEHARLHQRKQPVEVFDRDDLPPLAVDHRAKTFLPE